METTIKDNTYIIASKWSRDFERGDIVVFQTSSKKLVERIIALPGEHLKITDGKIYIDDKLLHEPYLASDTVTEGNIDMVLQDDEYFVLGDNRGSSHDSRNFGVVKEANIVGKLLYPNTNN